MHKRRIVIAVSIAAAAVALGAGAAIASAGDDDQPLTGSVYDRAAEAALGHVGGGTVIDTEVGDDGAAYGVEVELEDGSVVEVSLDADFGVVGSTGDDDGSEGTAGEDD